MERGVKVESEKRKVKSKDQHKEFDAKRIIFLLLGCAAFIAAVFLSGEIAEGCRYALKICAETLIPSLFPFFILSVLVNRLGLPLFLGRFFSPLSRRFFGVSGAGATALFLGLTGGYPMGAGYIADMYRQGQIDLRESEKLLAFCNNSGPAFIIGAVGCGVFGSLKTGVCLYIVHILSAVSVGILLRGKRENFRFPAAAESAHLNRGVSFSLAFTDAVKTAVSSILNVCAFSVTFTVIVNLVENSRPVSRFFAFLSEISGLEISCIRTFFSGLSELGCSLSEMSALSPTPSNLALVSFILGWGSLSVHMQTHAILADTEIKGTLHTAGRLLSASIASVLSFLLFTLMETT